jgi:hypothetical protein
MFLFLTQVYQKIVQLHSTVIIRLDRMIQKPGFLPEFIPTGGMPLARENGSAVSRWETGMTRQVDHEK